MLAAGVRILDSFSTLGHSLLVTLSVNLGQFKHSLWFMLSLQIGHLEIVIEWYALMSWVLSCAVLIEISFNECFILCCRSISTGQPVIYMRVISSPCRLVYYSRSN